MRFEENFRSTLEEKVADQLSRAGVKYEYEKLILRFTIPAFEARYKPDFVCGPIIIEAKGRFGHAKSDANGAEARQRLILAKEQNPLSDIRIVFQDARKPIYKGSKTTYAKWATDHGFKFSDKGRVPPEWIEEIKQQQRKKHDTDCDSPAPKAKLPKSPGAPGAAGKHLSDGSSRQLRNRSARSRDL
jgi:hypothetical protein